MVYQTEHYLDMLYSETLEIEKNVNDMITALATRPSDLTIEPVHLCQIILKLNKANHYLLEVAKRHEEAIYDLRDELGYNI